MFNKGALSLLAAYGNDSSDDEDVPGPRVSTKRTRKVNLEEESSEPSFKKLPLPADFLNNKLEIEHWDDPNLHEGRIRTFEHERGNWATYVYIPFENENVNDLFRIISDKINYIKLEKCKDYHISLTRTVILKHHWIEPFVNDVKLKVSNFIKFMIFFGDLNVYCNEERTRTFLGLEAITGYDTLSRIVNGLDKCLKEFNLPTFYKEPSFHMSIAWCVGDHEEELKSHLSELNERIKNFSNELCIYVETLYCKTGNKYYRFCLK